MMDDQALVDLALAARTKAYAPYSGFHVGAVLESEDGQIFAGCNVENAAYGECICAERTALVKAVSEGVQHFRRIAIAGSGSDHCWPCGACRQVLAEFAPKLTLLVSDNQGNYIRTFLEDLLPHHFGPNNL